MLDFHLLLRGVSFILSVILWPVTFVGYWACAAFNPPVRYGSWAGAYMSRLGWMIALLLAWAVALLIVLAHAGVRL